MLASKKLASAGFFNSRILTKSRFARSLASVATTEKTTAKTTMSQAAPWLIKVNSANNLSFVHDVPNENHSYTVRRNKNCDFGKVKIAYPKENSQLMEVGSWKIVEANGVLIFREGNSFCRFAFYPGNNEDFGVNRGGDGSGTVTFARGVRWVIQTENGSLVFRDMKSIKESRFAFFGRSGIKDLLQLARGQSNTPTGDSSGGWGDGADWGWGKLWSGLSDNDSDKGGDDSWSDGAGGGDD